MRREPSSPASKCKLKLKYLKRRLASLLSPSPSTSSFVLVVLASSSSTASLSCACYPGNCGSTGCAVWCGPGTFAWRWMWNVRVPFRWRVNCRFLAQRLAGESTNTSKDASTNKNTRDTLRQGCSFCIAFIACERMSLLSPICGSLSTLQVSTSSLSNLIRAYNYGNQMKIIELFTL